MTEKGLFRGRGESSFEPDSKIKSRLAKANILPPSTSKRDINYWLDKASRRSKDMNADTMALNCLVEVELPIGTIINYIGDLHVGHPNTQYDRIKREIEVIKHTKNSRVALMGDLVDGMWWGGTAQSEQSATLEEQFQFLNMLFQELGPKVIFAVSGEHDSKWASKTGLDPYCFFPEDTPYVRGVAEVNINTGNQTYHTINAHKLRGHSIYNNTHPQMRASREIQGADGYFSFHNHNKALATQPVRRLNGTEMVAFGAGGAYKTDDEYSQRSGWIRQDVNQMFGFSVLYGGKNNSIDMEADIIRAHKRWGK